VEERKINIGESFLRKYSNWESEKGLLLE